MKDNSDYDSDFDLDYERPSKEPDTAFALFLFAVFLIMGYTIAILTLDI